MGHHWGAYRPPDPPAFVIRGMGRGTPPNGPTTRKNIKINQVSKFISILIGSIIGFFSGLVGIGGGIFLSPLLFLLKAGYPKNITSSASIFILVNSIFGVGGQLTKDIVLSEFLNYWPLFLSVLIGGQIGNFLNIKFLSNFNILLEILVGDIKSFMEITFWYPPIFFSQRNV